MKARRVVILGAGGFAREVVDVFDARRANGDHVEVVGYLVDPGMANEGAPVNDLPILGGMDWLDRHRSSVDVICGVGAPQIRSDMVQRAERYHPTWCNAIHPTAVVTRWLSTGTGVVITAGCILTNQIRIDDHVQLNLNTTVGHDAVLRDFVTLSPGVHVSGNVTIGAGAYVGTGAVILEKRQIGAWSVVGAGAVVNEDIPADTTAVGVPAKVIRHRNQGWQLKL